MLSVAIAKHAGGCRRRPIVSAGRDESREQGVLLRCASVLVQRNILEQRKIVINTFFSFVLQILVPNILHLPMIPIAVCHVILT